MKQKKKWVKPLVIILIMIVVVVTAVVILSFVKKHNANKKEILVIPVDSVMYESYGYYDDGSYMDGTVVSTLSQKVYVTEQSKIDEILVSEGQEIKAGDVILRYDVTAQKLQLDRARADLALANNAVTSLERDLKRLEKIVPKEDMPKPEPKPEPLPTATASDAENTTESSETTETVKPAEVNTTEDELEDEPSEYDLAPTREELKKMIENKKEEIRDAKVNAALQSLSYEMMLNSNQGAELTANVDGVVSKVEDFETAVAEHNPLIIISNTEGLTIESTVGEYKLADIHIGDSVEVRCYDTGMSYEGVITSVGNMPVDRYSYGASQSYYPVEISVQDAGELSQGMYCEINLHASSDSSEKTYTMPIQFVKSEDGRKYVMIEEDGKLAKRYVKTGKTYWGSEIEILGGIKRSDYIAFPYLKDAVEGVRVRRGTMEELYGY